MNEKYWKPPEKTDVGKYFKPLGYFRMLNYDFGFQWLWQDNHDKIMAFFEHEAWSYALNQVCPNNVYFTFP